MQIRWKWMHFPSANAHILCKLDENACIFRKMCENANLNFFRFRRLTNIGLLYIRKTKKKRKWWRCVPSTMSVTTINTETTIATEAVPLPTKAFTLPTAVTQTPAEIEPTLAQDVNSALLSQPVDSTITTVTYQFLYQFKMSLDLYEQ